MRKLKNLFIILLTVTFIYTLTFGSIQVFAKGNDLATKGAQVTGEIDKEVGTQAVEKVKKEVAGKVDKEVEEEVDKDVAEEVEEELDEETKEDKLKEDNKNQLKQKAKKAWIEAKNKLEAEKDLIEANKDGIEAQKAELEKQLEVAEAAGDKVLVDQLKQQINQFKEQITTLKNDMKQIKLQMKEKIKSSYTPEEIQAVDEVSTELKSKHKDLKVLGVESVIAKGRNLKFDTPPVIKEGRTLIPIRAITEGFGAEIAWNAETKEVTITKDGKVMVLTLGSNTAVVNGETIQIDAKAESINGRTVVPLRFIIENLGLKVEWDSETETIEIEDEQTEESQVAEDAEGIEDVVDTGTETEIKVETGANVETQTSTETGSTDESVSNE